MTEKQENLFQSLSRMIEGGTDPGDHSEGLWRRYGEKVAVMVLDTSGFSRTTCDHGIVHFLTRLMQLRRLSAPVFEACQGRSVRFEADNTYAAFSHVDYALTAAQDIHREIGRAGLMLNDSEPLAVSIGIGYGELLYSETLEGHFGEEMNFASKLGEDLGSGFETRITESAYAQASTSLREGFRPDTAHVSGITLPHYVRTAALV